MQKVKHAITQWQEVRIAIAAYRTLNENLNLTVADLSPADYKLYVETIGGGGTDEVQDNPVVKGTSG